jgi:hypothetical protein
MLLHIADELTDAALYGMTHFSTTEFTLKRSSVEIMHPLFNGEPMQGSQDSKVERKGAIGTYMS